MILNDMQKLAMLQLVAPILGGVVGGKLSGLISTPVGVISPTIARGIMGAGILGGGYMGYSMADSFEKSRKKQMEEEALEIQKKQMGLI